MIFAFLFFQDLPPLRVAEVKKPNGALSLELRAPCKKELEEGFWSFLDQFGFRTKGSSHSRCLLPKEVLLLHKSLFMFFFCSLGSEHTDKDLWKNKKAACC